MIEEHKVMRGKYHKLWGILFVTMLQVILLLVIFSYKNAEKAPKSEYLESFGVQITTREDNFTCNVSWWQKEESSENEYYLTIPYFAKNGTVKANFVSGSDVYLNGEKLKNGGKISALPEGESVISCANREYRLFVIYGSDIPTVHITTDSGSMETVYADKTYKEAGSAAVLSEDGVVYKGRLDYITIRGNYTSTLAKKPFNIKFLEETDLFGMGKSKKWCLLANYLDDTRLKDKIGYDFAEEIGLDFSPESIVVDLYINEEYVGNYTLSERIEVTEDRINITDLGEMNEKANQGVGLEELELGGTRGDESYLECGSSKWVELLNTPEELAGGYLLEFELASRYDDEISGFITNYGQPVIVKSPEYASKGQVSYIQTYYQEFEDAVLSDDGYNSLGKHYSEYIDVASFAKLYVYQEFIKNLDGVSTSLFFYKEVGEKMVAGPVWDVDLGFGSYIERNGVKMNDPESLWITGSHLSDELSEKYSLFSLLFKHYDFREEARKQWETCFVPNIDDLLLNLDEQYEINKESIALDKFKWSSGSDPRQVQSTMEEAIETLKKFITQRTEFLSKVFSDKEFLLYGQWNDSNYLPDY